MILQTCLDLRLQPFKKFGDLLHGSSNFVSSVCGSESWPTVWPGGHAMLHRAGMKGGGKWHTYASLGNKARASRAMCHISESMCCSVCCSLKHEWNAVWASMLLSRWCQPHVCTFPLLRLHTETPCLSILAQSTIRQPPSALPWMELFC